MKSSAFACRSASWSQGLAVGVLFLGFRQELSESLCEDSVPLHVTTLVVGTTVESVERQKFAVRFCCPLRVACLFTVCLPCPLEGVQEFPDVLVLFGVIFTYKPVVDGE